MRTRTILTVAGGAVVVALASGLAFVSQRSEPIAPQHSAVSGLHVTPLPFEEARRIVAGLGQDVPSALREAIASGERTWHDWLAAHDEAVRARVDRGNEDSLHYFWLYGTSFSARPRATREALGALSPNDAVALVDRRLNDLLDGLERPGSNGRLAFGRALLERRGIAASTPEGREAARAFLLTVRRRVIAENQQLARASATASALADDARRDVIFGTMLSVRGLSSDTSIVANFAVMGALRHLASRSVAAPHSIARVAVIGPGLDFTDKADGHDFYPEQSMQPFAVIDALRQLGLQSSAGFELTTLDLNPRVNAHLEEARLKAAAGRPYLLHLPFDRGAYPDASPDFTRYWEGAGTMVGDAATPAALPAGISHVDVRARAVRPDVVLAITPRDLNIVTDRLTDGARFDLIIATNVLVYYDRVEQALALSNVSAMLRPGGRFLTNSPVRAPTTLRFLSEASGPVAITDHEADQMFWFEKRE